MIFGSSDSESKTRQCKHCGRNFEVNESRGWGQSQEQYTCDDCFRDGKRDWATDYTDEDTF